MCFPRMLIRARITSLRIANSAFVTLRVTTLRPNRRGDDGAVAFFKDLRRIPMEPLPV